MARTAKKEKLAQALVPDVEQPYRVPENWCWGYLTASFAECKDSYRKPINATERAGRIGSIPYYGATGQVGWIDDYLTDEELVLLGEDGAPFLDLIKDKAYLISGKAWVNNHAHILKSFFGHAGNLYLLHYLNAFNYTGYVNGTTRLKLTQSSMDTIPVPIAPFAEQQRIVDRIESLFAKLDEAKEKAQAVVDGFEDRKAAILHKAFTGELTEEWRRDNNVSKESWKVLGFDDCIDVMQNGIAKRKGDTGEPYVVLRLANLSDDGFDETDLREIVLDEKEQKNYGLHSDDVLMVRVNGSKDNVGKQYRITNQKRWAFCDHIIRIKYVNSIVPQYMVYFSKSETYRQYIKENMVSSAGQNTISRKGMTRLQITMPPKDEQEQIVSILSNLFEKEQQAKEAAEQVIDQIDTTKKSILSRAFRGELGTNDPNDESAVELLKRMLRDDVPAPQRAKPVKMPKDLSKSLRNDMEKKIIKLYFQRDAMALSVKEIMSVSSKTFEVLDCLRSLQNRQIITKQEDGNYRLMG